MKKNILLKIVGIALLTGQVAFGQNDGNANQNKDNQSDQSSQQDKSSQQNQQDQSSQQPDSAGKPGSSQSSTSGEKVTMKDLPQEVQETMRSQAGNLNVENIQKISKNGETTYQAQFDKGAMKGKLTVAEDGSLLQFQQAVDLALIAQVPSVTESQTALTELPQPVQETVKKHAESNEVGNISKSSKSGKTIYHAAFNEAGVHTDLLVAEDGELIARVDETALFAAPLKSGQSLSLQSAPQPVQQAVREHAGSAAQPSDVDKGTWNGQTAYKVMLEKDGMRRPLVISEQGEILGQQQASGLGAPAGAESKTKQNSKK